MLKASLWLALLLPTAAFGQYLKPEHVYGLSIEATAVHQGLFQIGEKQAGGRVTSRWDVNIGPDGLVRSTWTRNVQSPKGTAQRKEVHNGQIGQPANLGTVNFVWVLQEDKLVLLRAVEIGGHTASFKLERAGVGWTCAFSAAIAQEVGKGPGKQQSAYGGKVRMFNMKQVASTCKVKSA